MQLLLIGLLFIWAGFVRSGLGFGGAALGLPLMLFINDQPLFWLPMIGTHLLFFSGITLSKRLHDVDWQYLTRSIVYVLPAALIGVFGLLSLPNNWLVLFIYSVTLYYALTWLTSWEIRSNNNWMDRMLLLCGGYVAGVSLSGAPIMVAVFMRNVAQRQLRNTLFVLWFVLVSIKMTTFAVLNVDMHFFAALALIPVAAIGHWLGLRMHDRILQNDKVFRRVIGAVLMLISLIGLSRILLPGAM